MAKNNERLGIRLPKKENDLLRKTIKARGENLSSFLRRSILKELVALGMLDDEFTKKALGVEVATIQEK